MSAFLCSAYHIGRLAAYIDHHDGERVRHFVTLPGTAAPADRAARIAAALAATNVASVQGRYPSTVEDFTAAPGVVSECDAGPLGYIRECAEAARVDWRGDHSAADIEQAVRSYRYQSCEFNGWDDSDGAALALMAWERAVSELVRGIDQDGWCLDEAKSKRTAGISILELGR